MSASTTAAEDPPREAPGRPGLCRPNFLYVGVGKAGSTWIFEALKAHPQVFVPPAKDIGYFTGAYGRGPEWYGSFFKAAGPQHKAIGELSINYLQRYDALERIGKDLPQARILVSLRNPISRAWSAYTHMRRNNQISCTFREALDEKIKFVTEAGHYLRHLEMTDRYLPHNEIQIVLFDDLKRDVVAFGREIYAFLGVDPDFDHAEAKRNPLPASTARSGSVARMAKWGSARMRNLGMVNFLGRIKSSRLVMKLLYKPIAGQQRETMSEDDREYLVDLYRDDVEGLSKRLDRDLTSWLEPPRQR